MQLLLRLSVFSLLVLLVSLYLENIEPLDACYVNYTALDSKFGPMPCVIYVGFCDLHLSYENALVHDECGQWEAILYILQDQHIHQGELE